MGRIFTAGAVTARRARPLSSNLRAVADRLVGAIEDQGDSWGWCECPGADKHTNANARTDCKVVWAATPDGSGTLKPGLYCFHNSCHAEVEAAAFELRRALGKAQPTQSSPSTPSPAIKVRRSEPVFDPAKLERFAAKCDGVDPEWFAARSAKRVDCVTPASFLHHLYKPGESVVLFCKEKSQGIGVWTHGGYPFDATELDSLRARRKLGVWFLAAPVTGEFVPTGEKWSDGRPKLSRRSRRTVTSWRWLCIESDRAKPNHWLGLLAQLCLPICAIYTSGGNSIHALINIGARSEEEWRAIVAPMKDALIILGADPKMLSAVRLTRLPGCERLGKNGKDGQYARFVRPQLQQLYYLNPWADGTPICEIPAFPERATWELSPDDDSFYPREGDPQWLV